MRLEERNPVRAELLDRLSAWRGDYSFVIPSTQLDPQILRLYSLGIPQSETRDLLCHGVFSVV